MTSRNGDTFSYRDLSPENCSSFQFLSGHRLFMKH
uniref:Uncharacterized protein n=1 Tax=Rhizophora mucronata TaxID=61149 RepID=A0A2P2KRN3_RHIMU